MTKKKRALSVVDPEKDGLGFPTIMDREVATKYGAQYVHLAAFAIDIDRIRDEVEQDEGVDQAEIELTWPFAFEVFLTEAWILDELDPASDEHLALLEDAVRSAMARGASDAGQVFGAQLPFAIYDAMKRGALPKTLAYLFDGWKTEPRDLVADLAVLWQKGDEERARLARAASEITLEPPMAPPSKLKLDSWSTP